MSVPPIIYKQFRKYKPLNEMEGFQWFALTPAYGASYGDITRSYKFKREPKLLDIGNAKTRVIIENEIRKIDTDLVDDCHPDQQYSGTQGNKKCHKLIQNIFGDEYDGTIIDETQLAGNDTYPIEDLEGPTEIVIWKDYCDLLEELPEELPENNIGGKLTKRRTNKRRTNKRRTNKRKTNKRRTKKRRTNKRKKNERKTNKRRTNKRRTNK